MPDRWLNWSGGFAVIVGLAVWLGWLANLPRLASWLPGAPAMVLNTAFCMVLCGAGMLALARSARRTVLVCAGAVVIFGCTTQVVYLLGWSFGFDELLVRQHFLLPVPGMNRAPSNTVVAVTLLGAALGALAFNRRAHSIALAMCGVVSAFALLPIVKFVGARWEGAPYVGMSLPTIACLVVLVVALLRWTYAREQGLGTLPLLAATFGMLISIGVVTVQNNNALAQANEAVVHTYQVRGDIDHMVEEVARMESSARAFALTGEDYFLERVNVHRDEVKGRLATVRSLVADNPAQSARVVRLEALAEEKFAQSAELARRRQQNGHDAAAKYLLDLLALPGRPTSNLVILADEVRTEENRLLQERERTRELVQRDTNLVRALGGALALGLLGAAALVARRSTAARRTAEMELRASEERFRHLASAAFEAIILSENGRVLDVNEQTLALLGYSRAEMIGREILSMIAPESQAQVAEAVRSGSERTYENRVVRKDGTAIDVETQAKMMTMGERRIRMTALRDVTERKKFEEVLRASQRQFQRLFESSPDAIVLADRQGVIVRANARADTLFGWTTGALAGQRLDVLLPERFRVRHGAHLAGYFKNPHARAMGGGLELFGRRRDGTEFPVDIMLSPVETDTGVQTLAVVREITERKQFEQALHTARDEALAASRLKSEFLATVSHEIRTPMNGVIGMVTLLTETNIDDEQREMARIIQSSAESLLAIINDILDFSRMEAGKLSIVPQEFGLRSLIEETLALLAPRARQKGLTLDAALAAAPDGKFFGDAGRIRQVLTNLVGNALKFTDHGAITVRAHAVQNDGVQAVVRVSVEDTGIGIPVEAHGRLFQPFTQVDGSAARRHGGTGLGLAISRQLVALMGGEIGFTSEPGRGSTFWFEVALQRADGSAPKARPAPPAPSAPAKRLRVLLVDDNPANQTVARLLLEKLGHEVALANNGERALELLGSARFDAVLMDCQMPVLDGYETTRRIRAGAVPGGDTRVPIVALTAHALADARQRCLDAGMDDYVSKPVVAAELNAALLRVTAGAAKAPAPLPESAAADEAVLSARVVEMVRALPGRAGPSLWPEAVALFQREEPKWFAEIDRLAAARTGDELAAVAHTLAGSGGSFGAMELRAAALALERTARAGDWPGVTTCVAELRNASRRLHAALAALKITPSR